MNVSPKYGFHFLLGALDTAFTWGELWVHALCTP